MPELPEVETLRRSLEKNLHDDAIVGCDFFRDDIRFPIPKNVLRRAVGKFKGFERRSKYLLLLTDSPHAIVVHLGMSGRMQVVANKAPKAKHTHIAWRLKSGRELHFIDPRRFGIVEACSMEAIEAYPRFQKLGIEPLQRGFDGDYLRDQAKRKSLAVKNFIMDARVVVGIGNIYASESLFLAGVRPTRSVQKVTRAEWDAIATCAKQVLKKAIRQGGTTLNDFHDGVGNSGTFQVSLNVYGKQDQACACGALIKKKVLAARSSFYCPDCQR